MPTPEDTRLLLVAQTRGFLTEVEVARCVDFLARSEQAGQPANMANLLLERRILTPEQLQELLAQVQRELQLAPGAESGPVVAGPHTSSGPPIPGSGPPLPGSGPPLPGSGPPLPGSGPPLPGSGPPIAGSGPPIAGSGPLIPGSGPLIPGSGPLIPGSGLGHAPVGAGSVVGGVTLKREISRGGMGSLFEGYRGAQRVAVKVLSSGAAASPGVVASFREEARIAVSLSHPNLIRLLDTGVEQGVHFIVMDYFEGRSLAELIRSGRLVPKKALSVVATVAGACAVMHQHGVVHRDIKPATILVGKGGKVCLTDFGLAKDAARCDPTLTQAGFGKLLGTPAYMAPEQARLDGQRIGPWTDVYALGAVVFRALTGQFPFPAPGYMLQVQAIATGTPPRLRSLRPDAPAALDALIAAAMDPDPRNRPSAEQLGRQLETLLTGQHIVMPPGPPGEAV